MVDGIKLKYIIGDYDTWKKLHGINFTYNVNQETGEVLTTKSTRTGAVITKSRAIYKHYHIQLTEVMDVNYGTKVYYLDVRGSLHKSYFNGVNIENFSGEQMLQEIDKIEKYFALNLNLATIKNIEIGINIGLPFSPITFLNASLLSYKGKRFEKYAVDSNGLSIGYHCKLGQYSVKIYDKGLQNGLDFNIMRFEVRYIKMEKISRITGNNLETLKLLTKDNVTEILIKVWDGVLLDEFQGVNEELRNTELYHKVTNYHFMKQLQKTNRKIYSYLISKFKSLGKSQGNNLHEVIKMQILDVIKSL